MYAVTEIFPTIQGEGYHAGTPAVFCRMAGCNLWSGKESDREKAICKFCDTQFDKRMSVTAHELATKIVNCWRQNFGDLENLFVVFTGGEPALQVDNNLLKAIREQAPDAYMAMETNGTLDVGVLEIDWLCVSPKAGTVIRQQTGSELKVVWPQLLDLDAMERWEFNNFFLQPMDTADLNQKERNLKTTVGMVMARAGKWRVSIQTHKIMGVA